MATTGTRIKVTPQIAAEHGLSPDEFARIHKILGRDPNITELGIFSLMWSEHCSYKSSRAHLKRLPTTGPRVVQGPGENAGVVDIGDGLCAVFKIESHNHPSFVEPFQGAATGVGGILRDIFTMGARPIAVLDSLRFGEISSGYDSPGRGSPERDSSGRESSVRHSSLRDSSGHDFSRADQPANISRLQPLWDSSTAGDMASGAKAHSQGNSETARLKPCPDEEIARNRRILDGVVRGIGFYGNCFGVPTVAGEVQFEPCYANNPLVNALALGIARREELFFARARGAGNPVIYAGAKTGRDGIHGASLLASAEFSEESQQKRHNVQVGDPFMEKLLLEACLEAMRIGAVVSIQDMGAAGLTSSSSEMASRGGTGIEIELAKVPQREIGMTPYEIMLSESQERMLLVAERGREREVFEVFQKWGLDAVEVGRVTDDGKLRVLDHGRVVAEIAAHALAEEGPRYERPISNPKTAPGAQAHLFQFTPAEKTDFTENFRRLLGSPAIASKYWITEQYDSMVQTNTTFGPGAGDAAVLRLKDSKRALAIKTDGNGRWCWLAPRLGAMHAVAEAARNVACTGARPIAATNCLNFGNPEKPEVMWQFSEAVDGIAEACRILQIPITGGNVSFYNETLGRAIYPTPILGVLGLIEDAGCALGAGFRNAGDAIVLLDAAGKFSAGARAMFWKKFREMMKAAPTHSTDWPALEKRVGATAEEWRAFSCSEYAKEMQGVVAGGPPAIDLVAEKKLIDCLVALAADGAILSAHDVSDGGLAVTLAESCFTAASDANANRQGTTSVVPKGAGPSGVLTPEASGMSGGNLSAEISLTGEELPEAALFGERGARAVVSVSPDSLARLNEIAAQCGVTAQRVGNVTRGEFRIQYNGAIVIQSGVNSLRGTWSDSLARTIESAS